jgi:hypothetical protein
MSNEVTTSLSSLAQAHRDAKRYSKLRRLLSREAFQPAAERPIRWHLYFDGTRIVSAVCRSDNDASRWFQGPEISRADFAREDFLEQKCTELAGKEGLGKLGLFLHLADEVERGIVSENYEKPDAHEAASATVRELPGSVITDVTADLSRMSQWRTYPLVTPERMVALKHELPGLEFLEHLTEPELDVKVAVHSAPMEMLALLLLVYGASLREKAFCFALYYDRFTLLAPVSSGVLDLKVLAHRSQEVPELFGDDFFSLLEPLGLLSSCPLVLIPCGSKDPSKLFAALDSYAQAHHKRVDDLEVQILDRDSIWHTASTLAGEALDPAIIGRPEFLSAEHQKWFGSDTQISLSDGIEPEIQRFGILARESFFPDDRATREKRLPRSLAIVMLSLRIGRYLGILFLLGLAGILGYHVFSAYRSEAMQLVSDVVNRQNSSYEELTASLQYAKKWGKNLMPRSNTWSVMDFVLTLLPENPEIACDNIHYVVRSADLRVSGNAANKAGGFVREWTVTGFCSEQGRQQLAALQQNETLTRIFNNVAQRLNQPIFAVENQRSVKAASRTELNSGPGLPGAKPLAYKFLLVVTQTIPGDDSMALPIIAKVSR